MNWKMFGIILVIFVIVLFLVDSCNVPSKISILGINKLDYHNSSLYFSAIVTGLITPWVMLFVDEKTHNRWKTEIWLNRENETWINFHNQLYELDRTLYPFLCITNDQNNRPLNIQTSLIEENINKSLDSINKFQEQINLLFPYYKNTVINKEKDTVLKIFDPIREKSQEIYNELRSFQVNIYNIGSNIDLTYNTYFNSLIARIKEFKNLEELKEYNTYFESLISKHRK